VNATLSRQLVIVAAASAVLSFAGPARAQSAPTCSFAGGVLSVTVNGNAATLSVVGGNIRLNNANCTGATTSSTDSIQINGGALADKVTLTGTFAPGATPDLDGGSEIEIGFALAGASDTLTVKETTGADLVTFTAGGIDVGNDGDEDITTAGVEVVKLLGLDGDDDLDAALYAGGGKLYLYGGNGSDGIIGSAAADWLYGEAGDDTIAGGDGNDQITDGTGIDLLYGDGGNDKFKQQAATDMTGGDADDIHGGAGTDTVDYSLRTERVWVTLNDTVGDGAWDGAANLYENDNAASDLENIIGGAGNDYLAGTDVTNTLTGGAGEDTLVGWGGVDILKGGTGYDHIWGGYGNDKIYGEGDQDELHGEEGNDTLWGGASNDAMYGEAGKDTYYGEDGNDLIYNNDGIAETVDCGPGASDDVEPSAGDSFIACEIF